jgi:GDP-mannose 6-dehydrogenase
LSYEARILDIDVPLLSSILISNKQQILRVVSKLLEFKGKTIGFMGLSFKGGTDDLRESPLVEVIETLIGKGFAIRIFDRNVSIARLMGANREYIQKEIPHVSTLMCESPEQLLGQSDVIVIGNKEEEFRTVLPKIRKEQTVIDLVRIVQDPDACGGTYYGVCW